MDSQTARSRPIAWPETVLGLGVVAMALIATWQANIIPSSPLYSRIGPTIFPRAAAALLFILGALLVYQGWRGGWQEQAEKDIPLDWRALGLVLAGLIANAALIGTLGFVLASTLLFTLVAAGFGSRRPWFDAPIGFTMAMAAYFGFAGALGVNIGAGPFERAVGAALGI